jgi:hypothetical protein
LKFAVCRYGSAKSLNWEQINNEFGEAAGVFLLLVDLLLSIPAHSVECERGFSLLKVIKTDWRNRLTDDAVTDLMRISLDSADIKEFNPDPAIHLWQQAVVCGRGRRPSQKIWKKTKAKQIQSRNVSGSDTESDAVSEYSKSDQESSNESSNEDENHEMELNSTGLDLFNSDSSEESDFERFHI